MHAFKARFKLFNYFTLKNLKNKTTSICMQQSIDWCSSYYYKTVFFPPTLGLISWKSRKNIF